MPINFRALVAKLNGTSRNALEGAAGLCLSRTHYDIEIEHVLLKLLDAPGCDFLWIARHFGVDTSRLTTELMRSLDRFKSGNGRTPGVSPSVLTMLREAWTFGSLEYNAAAVRTGFLIVALAETEEL